MKTNQTVLITGATSGIGLELARLFADNQFEMVIVARDEQHLKEVAEELEQRGAPVVTAIAVDLSLPGGPKKVFAFTQAQGLTIDILVNDAGAGVHGFFGETDLEKELRIIQLNAASLVHLTKLYLKGMLERREGRILQLASIASYQPTPLLAVYAATKAFVLSFTDALINELKDTHVTLTALIPGPTDTDFFHKAGAEHTKAAQHPEDPAVVAKIGYDALMSGQHHAVAPGVKPQIVMSSVLSSENVAARARKQMEEEESPKKSPRTLRKREAVKK